ncbi:MAG TPA: hypothetical protein VMU41_03420 [Candidatus Binataceae bacterium]|nr:hypothetical protein [Candidatus Binataceae bacterium]
MGIAEILLGIVAPLLLTLGFGFLTLSNPTSGEFLAARICAVLALLDVAGFGGYWLYAASQLSIGWKLVIGGALGATIFALGLGAQLWVDARQYSRAQQTASTTTSALKPSFVFVFGAPLGDNRSATWLMMLLHFGPESAYNCNIDFYDNDRKNIEHLWHVKHPNLPFVPTGQFDESQKRLYVAEAGVEDGTRQNFTWTPLDPNSQHYTVRISCRAGAFIEKWEVTRVNGILRAKIIIEHGPEWIRNRPEENPLVFKCEDPEFVGTPLATAIPGQKSGLITHPGWKPNYRFEVPVAIIDPNGNLQIASGIKQPDGTTRTDFGCWNILSKHFGE